MVKEQLDPRQVARFKRHLLLVAVCFAAAMALRFHLDRNQESLAEVFGGFVPDASPAHEVEM